MKILPIDTYNQPYAIVMAAFLLARRPKILLQLPSIDRLMLGWLAVLGCLMLLVQLPDGLVLRELMFLLSYLTPLLLIPVTLYTLRKDIEFSRRILSYGIFIWVGVGLVQRLVDPSFLGFLVSVGESELGLNLVNSGRGVLSLAPEPTHFGFHMIALGATLIAIGGPAWIAFLAIFSSIFLALSTSALAALAIGFFIWMLVRLRRWPVILIIAVVSSGMFQLAAATFDDSTRIGHLIRSVGTMGFDIFLSDFSVNSRFYGFYAPIRESVFNLFAPIGISVQSWGELSAKIMSFDPNIMFLSLNGPASGFGLLLVQGGFFALPVLVYFFHRMCVRPSYSWRGVFACAAFAVFLGQIYLATPSFSLLFASLIYGYQNGFGGHRTRIFSRLHNGGASLSGGNPKVGAA
ncbi:hypothetical protein [Variovorax sp.]|uniref:hypothetical protein n=1 Tax=Variovorax sp. TaxID=1871043 RepID=UPI0037DA4C60